MNLSIVYKDTDLLVINKPTGLLSHPVNRKDTSESVVGLVLKKHPEIKSVVDEQAKSFGQWVDLRPGIVHRLDKETSGLMIIAKNQPAFDYLKKLFQERKIKKTYLALVYGQLKEKRGRIELPLGKIGTKQTIRLAGKKELKDRSAVTDYKVIAEFGASQSAIHPLENSRATSRGSKVSRMADWPVYSLLEVYPKTGRTHQIRVHFNSIGHPIVCDPLYGGRKKYCPPELGRLFLHAQKLEFTSPSGQRLHLEVELPSELTNFLNSLTISQ